MATYKEIQNYVKDKYGFVVKTCWIAHMKEQCGLKPRLSPKRHNPLERKYQCPEDKQGYILEAFRYFRIID